MLVVMVICWLLLQHIGCYGNILVVLVNILIVMVNMIGCYGNILVAMLT